MLELILILTYITLTAAAIFIIRKLVFAFRHFTLGTLPPLTAKQELPSVSVCIPARNETHAMTQCLESVLASSYPKLEVIVLDDASIDNTSILIKSFAHAGVRFVEGSPLPEGWLGKNHALQGLLGEASGSYILYVDVDTRLKPNTISDMVAYALEEEARMVSVMPQRNDGWRSSVLFSPLRYFWELLTHHYNRPAVSSSMWLIHRNTLISQLDGFLPYRLEVQPEARFAAQLSHTDQYRFLISSVALGVSYEKKYSSQVETSIRLLYPRFGGRLLSAVTMGLLLLVVWSPIGILMSAPVLGWTFIHTTALWELIIFMALYGYYLSKVWSYYWWMGALMWPIILSQEIVLLAVSCVKYLRGTVTWKGRSVLAPKEIRRLEAAE